MRVVCSCEGCKHYEDEGCELETIYISDSELTAAGFLPQCEDYEEEE